MSDNNDAGREARSESWQMTPVLRTRLRSSGAFWRIEQQWFCRETGERRWKAVDEVIDDCTRGSESWVG